MVSEEKQRGRVSPAACAYADRNGGLALASWPSVEVCCTCFYSCPLDGVLYFNIKIRTPPVITFEAREEEVYERI